MPTVAEIRLGNKDIRSYNRINMLRLLFDEGALTQADIKKRLKLSGPTITQNIQEFMAKGLLQEGSEQESSGGRRPHLIEFCYNTYHVVGIEVRRHHVDIRVINLHGDTIYGEVKRIVFENTPKYWEQLNLHIRTIAKTNDAIHRLLGVGIAFPGEVSANRDYVIRSTVLGVKNLSIAEIQKHFSYPVYVEYGANAAGFGTVWRSKELKDAVYVIVTNNGVAGSIILNNEIYHGRAGRAGAFGHITLNPSGRKCFCGACGCWSAYNALNALTGLDETDLDGFFEKVNNEDPDAIAKWDEYLTYFADGLSTVSMSFDIDIVIGGPLAVYLEPWLDTIISKMQSRPTLNGENISIHLDTKSESPMAEGVALMIVAKFLNDELDNFRFDEL